jgi:hypothetical protein
MPSIVASRIPAIKTVLNTLIARAGGTEASFSEVLGVDYPTSFPASTLMLTFVSQTDVATGGLTANEWRFIQRSYFDYTAPAEALEEMDILIEGVLTEIRRATVADLTLPDGTPIDPIIIEDGGDPEEAPEERVAFKTLYLTVRTEEI